MKDFLILANSSDGLYGFRRELLMCLEKEQNVYVAIPNSGYFEELTMLGCQVVEIEIDRRGINPITDFQLLIRYFNMVRTIKPDLVITYTIKPNVYGGMVCRLLKIPYAANITGLGTAFQNPGFLRRLVTILYKSSLRRAKTVFFENQENQQIFLDEGIVREEQCCLLNGAGVNLERYAYAPYPADTEEPRFLFVGRVMKEKGVDELFVAMEKLRAEGYACTLDVLGNYEEDYAERIARYVEAGWLRYHGYQKDVRPFIRQAHCFVLPSWHEGMANTNLECAAMGRPVITSRIHGCMEAVREEESGLLCTPKDPESLYKAMREFLSLDVEQRAAMGQAGRRRMEEVFDKRKVVRATMERLL